MPKLIDTTAALRENPWHLLPKDSTLEQAQETASNHIIVPLALWLAQKPVLQSGGKQVGVWLDSNEQVGALAEDLDSLALVALNFPGFMDGRAYSGAVTLRQRYGFQGEIRAIGDVLRDQLFYMKRCGFSTFDLSDSVQLADAIRAMQDFSDSYQSTVECPAPLFARRQAS